MSFMNVLRGSLLAGVLALFCSMLVAAPAEAAFDQCPQGSLCLYDGPSGGGNQKSATQPVERVYGAWDDMARSVRNNTSSWACLYEETEYGGGFRAVAPGNSVDDLAAGTGPIAPSSHKLVPSRGHCFTGFERCMSQQLDSHICLFTDVRGRGQMFATTTTTINVYVAPWENNIQSVMNRGTWPVCFYKDRSLQGTWTGSDNKVYEAFIVLPGESATMPPTFQDSFSSHQIDTSSKDCKRP
ncbi:peptidase inhibitor family I36 protein [Streptomyces sp. NPDC002812]|uniref:peptidase inhibitor family I36 protein n=1 Tax=Streptomyces sp. NPDC002812 TaxID=3154434 RepID=UPI0033306F74